MCINYANEQLQHLFNKSIFEHEQELYDREGIKWESLQFTSNEETVDLFSRRPIGILRVLDDESQFPKVSYLTVVRKSFLNLVGSSFSILEANCMILF